MLDARLLRTVPIAAPAAGAEWSQTVPGGEVWRPVAVVMTLVTDANVAARRPRLVYDDGTTQLVRVQTAQGPGATQAFTYSFAVGLGYSQAGGTAQDESTGIPDIPLQGGWRIRSSTVNLQVGDQYSVITLLVSRYSPSDLAQQVLDIDHELSATALEGIV